MQNSLQAISLERKSTVHGWFITFFPCLQFVLTYRGFFRSYLPLGPYDSTWPSINPFCLNAASSSESQFGKFLFPTTKLSHCHIRDFLSVVPLPSLFSFFAPLCDLKCFFIARTYGDLYLLCHTNNIKRNCYMLSYDCIDWCRHPRYNDKKFTIRFLSLLDAMTIIFLSLLPPAQKHVLFALLV